MKNPLTFNVNNGANHWHGSSGDFSVMKFLILFFLIFLPGFADADYTHPVDVGIYSMSWSGSPVAKGQNPTAVCTQHAANYTAHTGIPHVFNAVQGSGTTWACQWKRVSNNQLSVFINMPYTLNGCHDGDTLISGPLCLHPEEGDPCPIGQVTGPGGICTSDPNPDETPCRNVAGYVNGVEVCLDDKNECEQQGGTYGIIMDEAGCLLDDEDPEKECAAEMFVFGNDYGGYVCVHPDDKNPDDDTPDPNDADGDGVPNDEDPDDDNDGIPDEEDPDANGDGRTDDDSDEDGIRDYEDDDDDNDGVSDSDDKDNGAGQCDPTAFNYAQCTGQLSSISDTAGIDIRNAANLSVNTAVEGVTSATKAAIGNGNAGITEPTGLVASLTGFSGFADRACVDLSTTVHGVPFSITCDGTQPIRNMLTWVFGFLALFYIVHLAFGAPGKE